VSPVQSPCFGSPSSVCSDVAHSISNEPNLPTLSPFSPSSQRGATKPTPFAHLLFIILGHILALPWSCSFPRKPTTRAFPSGSFHFLSGLLCVCGCFVKSEWHSFGFTYFLFSSTSACFLQLLPLVLRLRPDVCSLCCEPFLVYLFPGAIMPISQIVYGPHFGSKDAAL